MQSIIVTVILAVLGSSGLAAIIVACLNRHWTKKDKAKASVDDMVKALQQKHDEDIGSIQDEQTLIVYGLLACLKGLSEQGCNGPVTEAIGKIEKHLNKKAHEHH